MKRIGLIVVDNNGGSEYDFWKLSPKGVGIYTTRMKMRPSVSPGLHEPADMKLFRMELKEEINKLSDLVDVIVYQRTYGTHKNYNVIKEILEETGKPYVIAEHAALEYFKEMGVRRVWLFTPYGIERTEEEAKFLEENGLEVPGYTYLGLSNGLEYSNVEYKRIFIALIRNPIEADALYLHCTNLTTYKAIVGLRETLGIPVFSENSTSLLLALKKMGVKPTVRALLP
ncbi:hypothetical protein [Candidatus Acidianus copahuensis]|uniref:aspartate racemase/maleate isomerase family protein n=1 Tax=Candidatus Acidianus copahuensis TaxID=1160895 RepID=UPI00069351E5|nr:hypothetical protein [Candidatus Acidianus copahuensis]